MLYIPCKRRERKSLRKQKKEALDPFPTFVTPRELPFPEASRVKLYEKLFWSAFSELPDHCQRVLLLTWRHYSSREISAMLHIPEDRIRERKNQCTRMFVSKVKEHKAYGLLTNGSPVDK